METAVTVDHVQHIIIDSLQLMTAVAAGAGGGSDHRDIVVNRLNQFAKDRDVNVILTVYPIKEEENVPLNMASIFGKASQVADLMLILQVRSHFI